MKNNSKKWLLGFLLSFVAVMVLLGGIVAFIDPYFHYHAPLNFVKYELRNERYQNNGIVKHFDYDAIITGSSMTECFKTSDLNELFGVNSVKVPYSGGSLKEVNDNLVVATRYNPNIKMVVRGLDANRFFNHKDSMDYDNCPDYLYDDYIWNDAQYLFNKDILVTALQNLHGFIATGNNSLNFDLYANWSDYETYGKAAVAASYHREDVQRRDEQLPITEEEYAMMEASIRQNITALAASTPDIQYYIYISPYNIYYFDYWNLQGLLERHLLAEKFYIEQLLPYENIHVFSFYSEYDLICNLDYYKDVAHHSGDVNSQILQWMKEGSHELTAENYEAYCQEVWDFYTNYDYDALFAESN